jgi:uncharacterized membrane protein YebE (DUF533 family)
VDTVPGLRNIEQRKRDLVLESELNRQVLRLQAGELNCHLDRFRGGLISARSLWKLAAMAGGVMAASRVTRSAGILGKATSLMGMAGVAWKAWQSWRTGQTQEK